MNQFSIQASMFVGQAAGGILYSLVGPTALFLIDSLSYFFAAGAESFIPRDTPVPRKIAAGVHPFRHFLHETAEGFRWVWARKGMRDFMFGVSLINFLAMMPSVLFPFYVKLYLHAGPKWYGFLMAAMSVGAVLGFVTAGSFRLTGPARARGILAALAIYPVCFGTLAFIRTPALAFVAVLFGGMMVGYINVSLITLLQGSTPNELRGRVMGLLGTLGGALIPLGLALGGVVGDLTHKNFPLVVLVTTGMVLLIAISLGIRKSSRDYLAYGLASAGPGAPAAP
jgi:MFS family permease